MRKDVRDDIAAKFVDALNAGILPWRQPWANTGLRPRNMTSQRPYRGINAFYLALLAQLHGYTTGEWSTVKQILKLGGRVRRDQWDNRTSVVFCQFMTSEKIVNGKTQKSSFPMWKSYIVYNRDQCEGLPEYVPQEQNGAAPIESAQSIVDGMKNAPRITVCDSDRAFYMPSADSITMPRLAQFYNAESYYSTMFHEMAHSTGHKSRLNRPGVMESQGFGSESYSKEELVAEITAAFLCGEAGILDKVEQNSKAYVQNWASRIGKEPKILMDAIGQAQKAADCILGVTFGKEGAEE